MQQFVKWKHTLLPHMQCCLLTSVKNRLLLCLQLIQTDKVSILKRFHKLSPPPTVQLVNVCGETVIMLLSFWITLYLSPPLTVQLGNVCGETVIMILENQLQMKVTLTLGMAVRGCDVIIEGWYTWDRLMFYFEDLNLPCNLGSVSIFDGENSTVSLESKNCNRQHIYTV